MVPDTPERVRGLLNPRAGGHGLLLSPGPATQVASGAVQLMPTRSWQQRSQGPRAPEEFRAGERAPARLRNSLRMLGGDIPTLLRTPNYPGSRPSTASAETSREDRGPQSCAVSQQVRWPGGCRCPADRARDAAGASGAPGAVVPPPAAGRRQRPADAPAPPHPLLARTGEDTWFLTAATGYQRLSDFTVEVPADARRSGDRQLPLLRGLRSTPSSAGRGSRNLPTGLDDPSWWSGAEAAPAGWRTSATGTGRADQPAAAQPTRASSPRTMV
jgi:hypothetical protein